jgi:formamidopyrimidine-DNA glycosylase
MPELAEVEWYRTQWEAGLGDKVTAVELHARNRVFRGSTPRELETNLMGQKLLSSQSRGKRMLFQFSNDNWLGVHLGMTGTLRVEPAGFERAKHDHLVLRQTEHALVYRDSRQFGRIRFHHGHNEPDWWNMAVPEIVSPQFDRMFLERFLNRHQKAPIKAVLLLQNGFSGIGNWMADEILWRAKILPSKRPQTLTAKERAGIFRATKFVVKKSLETLGRNFSDPPKNWLIHQKWRRDGVCPRHRTPLCHATIAGRTTAWCARCQK